MKIDFENQMLECACKICRAHSKEKYPESIGCPFREIDSEYCDKVEGFVKEYYKVGNYYRYSFNDSLLNASIVIVKLIRILSDQRGIGVIEVKSVLNDDSGNGFFNYLLKSNRYMNVSLKYLTLIRTGDNNVNQD